ncbi:hypothetical protein CALVIDRAFT_554734 [Calocera viscosa TUFC12733]|uniref:RING-CH-type domain-containing protein n=1 Tax=Calocera viscosa (strain TUFC12733) TaxID=1330018 RepID=A0A167MW35_CALVF|nr:hypothetical protein CALVIDRAFT_554734 [Calocera viscosa TUFC12733]
MMQLSKLFLAVFAFIAVAVALPVSTSQSGGLARRSSDLASRSDSFALDESTSLLVRTFGEDDEEELEMRDIEDDDSYPTSLFRREDECTICLEAEAKYSNCPNGAAHPAHVDCLLKWAQTQTNQGKTLTCAACRTKVAPLIKKVKQREVDEEELEMRDVDDGDSYPTSLFRREDECTICLEAEAKHSNCPNGAAHPAHIECLMKWAQAQANEGKPLTCNACRAKISPLIKKVKQREVDQEELEMRDVDEELEMRDVDDDESYPTSLFRREDECTICLEAEAKHSSCPNGAAHPAHVECLMKWAQAQANEGKPLTCNACRAKISPLIKKVKD